MALNSPYLAAENSASDRRSRALHRFIVASPILLLIAVGLVGHLRHEPHVGSASLPDFDRRVLAYRERVVAAEALPDREQIPVGLYLDEARRWNAGFANGTLTPLLPAAYEDHLRDGIRGEVFRSGMNVASNLTVAAERDINAGKSTPAAASAIVAAELANGLHGFELQACLQALLLQRRAVNIVSRAWPKLTSADRTTMRATLAKLRIDRGEVERLAALDAEQLHDYFRRQKLSAQERPEGSITFGRQAIVSIDRSVALSNARIDSLLKVDPSSTTTAAMP